MASQSGFDVGSIFDEARKLGTLEGRFDPSSAPQTVVHSIIFWSDGFSVNDGPLRQLDDPENAPFLECIRKSDCPRELQPEDRSTEVHINLIRRDGKCPQDLVVDKSLPWTSIQLKLADDTRMTAEFNCHHTISDIRTFIDTSRPGSPSNYQLRRGFPPTILSDPTQTIEQAGLANSVVIQKF